MTDTSTPITSLDPTERVDLHLAAYAEPDPTTRADLVARAWADGGQLIDPPFDGTGRDEVAAMADAVLAHYPAHTFRRTTAVDEHHGFARYGWELVGPDGTVAVNGTDVAQFGEDGALVRVVGFFGDLVPA